MGVLTIQDLQILEQISKEFGNESTTKMGFEIAKLGLRSRAEVFSRIKAKNNVKKHLEDSITNKLKKSFGEVIGIRFDYNWYGLFYNTGAQNVFGKGLTHPAHQWQAAALNPEIEKLATKVAGFYADVMIKNIEFKKI